MSTTAIAAALMDVRAEVWAAQVAVVRAGTATWAGDAADAAEARRHDLLTDLRRCLDALDAADRLVDAARHAEQRCVAGRVAPLGARSVAWA
ncbi:hypothetical protein [Cellulomonas dongxiuzhuiae]|uniref:hypothetical protein n=1 Tax=Cellulomonas dongxiuzhuiae TaxID=2819979 RepID=UPI001AAF05F6|nr:hypothetical protein [Cellulomonas dongxiuzhuiae]MBO3089341.1 hypothetical protein [Cellulomonas dongxiuzhuiae]